MRLLQPDPAAALLGLRAMKTVATTAGAIGPSQRALMETARRMILHIDADIDALPAISPAELAAGFPTPELRQQLVNGMLVTALADGVPTRATLAKIEDFAAALGIAPPELTDLRRLSEHHMLLFKLDFLRRSQVGDSLRDEYEQRGLVSLIKSILGMRGLMEDPKVAARYQAWEKLPQNTLGHALWQYFRRNNFGMPGEKGGFPEGALYHDFCHVLGGYPTTPAGEIQVAAFVSGFKQKRPLYIVLFAVLTFGTGVDVRPFPGEVTTGVLAQAGVAELMFAAIERGSKVNVDLSDKWDYWPYVELPIDEARRRLNILPSG